MVHDLRKMSNFVGLASANDDVLREIFAWAEYVLPITWKPIRNADGSNRRVDREGVSTECRAYNLGWVRFSQVCRRWRTISLDNSGPWARNVNVIIPAHRTFLYRARERTIVLDMRFVDPRIPVTPELLKRVDTLICNEVGSRYWKPLLHNHHLPRLRIFSVEGPCHLGDSVELDAPNLQSLSLASLRAVYTNSLPTLRTLNLDLKSMPSERWQLLDILSKAPNLEELHVPLLWRPDVQEDVWNPPRHLWDWGFFGGGVVQLGSLRRLNLEVDSSSGVVEFFERIRASDDASVCIHYHDRSDADRITALRNSLTQYDRLGTGNAIRLLSGYTVIPGPRRYSDLAEFALFHHVSDDRSIPPPLDGNNIPLDGIAFRFHYSNMSVLASIFRQLTHDIDADRIAHIDFDASLTFYERESVITMLSAFTEVKSLHIGGFFAAGPLLQLLARPELFPSLQEVLITIHKNWAKGEDRWATWWEEIVAVLDWRANGGVSIDRLVLLGTWRPAELKNGARMTDEAGLTEARRRVRVLVDRREVL